MRKFDVGGNMFVEYNPVEDTGVNRIPLPTISNPQFSIDTSLFKGQDPKTGEYEAVDTTQAVSDEPFNINYNMPEITQVEDTSNTTKFKSTSTDSNSQLVSKILDKATQNNINMQPYQASAIVGHIMAESGGKAGAYNKNDLGARAGGLCQWRDKRFDALKNFASKQSKPWTDLDTQIDFLFNELKGTHKNELTMLLNSKNYEEASRAWSYFEKHAGYDGTTKTARKAGWSQQRVNDELEKRRLATEQVYKAWSKGSQV